jgi:hypothetical protein
LLAQTQFQLAQGQKELVDRHYLNATIQKIRQPDMTHSQDHNRL